MKRNSKQELVKYRKIPFALLTVTLCILLLAITVAGQPTTTYLEQTSSPVEPELNFNDPLLFVLNDASKVYIPNSTDQLNAVAILNNVALLNLSSYTIRLNEEKTNDYFGLSQNQIEYCLSSPQGSMRIACSFIDSKLHQIYISDWTGSSLLDQEFSEVNRTKNFLRNYQDLTKSGFYGTLLSILDDVKLDENVSKTEGNINLKISVIDQASTNFIWTYVDDNGVIAQSKNVVLSYSQGYLQCFQDNWDLYKISGAMTVSEEEAKRIALSAIDDYAYDVSDENNVSVTVSGFKAKIVNDLTLSYLNEFNPNARGNDTFTLYPSWYVPLGFDKVYAGGVTGAVVRVWADNGQVSSINPMIWSEGNTESTTNNMSVSGLLPNALLSILAVGIAVTFSICMVCYRRSSLKPWKAFLLSGIIMSSLLTTTVQAVYAYPNSKAEVYSSYWGQLDQEKNAMQTLTSTIQSYFSSVGYDTGRYCGTETNTIVYTNIQNDQIAYNRVAVFHFGHMAGAGNYYCSDDSVVTYPYVYSYTNNYPDKHFFACMWVCNSADNSQYQPDVNALARSWSHHNDLVPNGYTSPDASPDCFIGFHNMSPTLTWAIYNTTTVPGYNFIEKFYWYALIQGGYSVRDSLNQASLVLFGVPFDETDLLSGVYSYYPGDDFGNPPGDYPCTLKVYGNSNIYLRQYYPYIHVQSIAYGSGAVNNPTNILGNAPDGAYTQLYGGNYGDGGMVVSMMTGSLGSGGGFSRGHIYLYGYSVSGYDSHLYVYVSQNNNNDWQLVYSQFVSSSTPGWIDIGQAPSDFKYIAVAGYRDTGYSVNLMVDAVRVIP